MKRVLPLLFGILSLAAVSAQDRQAVSFKVFPPDYEVFVGGDRLNFTPRGDGLRTYQLPVGPVRVNLTAPGTFPVSLALEVKPGVGQVQAKLEPRTGALTSVAEAATGKLPRSVAFSADGKRLFVALQAEPGIDVFEVPSLKKIGRFTAGAVGFTDVIAQGDQVWALSRDGQIQVFGAQTLAAVSPIALANSGSAGFADLGGGKVLAANWDYGTLTQIDATTKKTTEVASLGGSLRGLAVGAGTVYAALFDQGRVTGLDSSTWKTKASWGAGKAPRPLAVQGTAVFVGDMASAQVLVIDGTTGKLVTTVGVASNPHQMASTAGLVAVASRGRNNPTDYQLQGPDYGKVTLLDAKGTVVGSVWGRNQPTGLAFSPDGKYLAFTDFLDNNVELYRITR